MNKIIAHVPAAKDVSYPVYIDTGLLNHPDKWLPNDWREKKIAIITDDTVKSQYGDNLVHLLQKNSKQPLLFSFMPGEKSKNYQTIQYLQEQMFIYHCDRETVVLALGGGVVGDVAGFVAATYMRGIRYIQIPTTLLAMVDSSVGGKTGIDTAQGKNLIGAFWQPLCVVADLNCLKTLSKVQMIHGLVEALKMFMTSDAKNFDYVIHHLDKILKNDDVVIKNIIHEAVKIKIGVVNQDEKENNLRMILNFGHTIGHAIEQITHYTILHGYAVALGILVEAKISQLLGILANEDYQTIKTIFSTLDIFGKELKKINIENILQATTSDKKAKQGIAKYVLLKKLGQVHVNNNNYAHVVSDEIVKTALLDVSCAC